MGLKPVESLVYFYYECSKCGERGDEMRLSEVSSNNFHTCIFCGHVDNIKPVRSVVIKFGDNTRKKNDVAKPTKSSQKSLPTKYSGVVKSLVSCGWGKRESEATVLKLADRYNDSEVLFKQAVLDLEEANE